MKRLLFIILLFFIFSFNVSAQREYWGMASGGGNYCRYDSILGFIPVGPWIQGAPVGGGVIFKTDDSGTHQQVMHKFDSATGFRPIGGLTLANNGKIYGMTNLGGPGAGTLFQFDPVTNVYTVKKYFEGGPIPFGNNGVIMGSLLLAGNGKLYGIYSSPSTGTNNYALFSFDPATDIFTHIYNFGYFGGDPVQGPSQLMQASNGKIYIPLYQGGGIGYGGALYEYNITNNTTTLLYKYLNSNGSSPGGPLIEFTPGVLYGTFTNGDSQGLAQGGVYKYDIATNTHTKLARLDTITGLAPYCGLTRVGNKLYGATYAGGFGWGINNPYAGWGIIFEFDPSNQQLRKLHELGTDFHLDPNHPTMAYVDVIGWGTELLATNGLLYGLTSSSMFSFNVTDAQFSSLLPLNDVQGSYPQRARLIEVCTKPYYTDFTSDTLYVTPGSIFNFIISSKNADSFHWQKNTLFTADTDSILNFNSFTLADTGRYTCRLVNECGNIITKSIYLRAAGSTPVILLSLTAILESNKNSLLRWKTSLEINNDRFNIQRSIDGINFIYIGKVNGNGTTDIPQSYKYEDIQTPEALVFYRLQQVDYDGRFTYSPIVTVDNKAKSFSVITNNHSHTITTHFSYAPAVARQYSLFAINGQRVRIFKSSEQTEVINTTGIAAGIYQLQVKSADKVFIEKIIIDNQ